MTQWLARVFEFVSADSGTPTCPRAKPPAQGDKQIPSTRKNEGANSQHGNRHHRYPPSLCLNPNPGCWGPCTSVPGRYYRPLLMPAQETASRKLAYPSMSWEAE